MEQLLQTFEEWKPIEGKGAVYLYTFENGKKYVGITRYSVMSRYKNHLRSDNVVDRALKKYKHSIKILKIVDDKDLSAEEIRLIAEHDCLYPKGYNCTLGGEGGMPMLESTKQKISFANSGEKNGMYGKHYKKSPESIRKVAEAKSIPIRCIDTGKTYSSMTEASKDTHAKLGHISSCCNGYRDIAGGLRWEYVDEFMAHIGRFNRMCHWYSKKLNWKMYCEEHKDELRERGYKLSQSNIGTKRKPYNYKNKKA